jgi:signal transduction histidine kinase
VTIARALRRIPETGRSWLDLSGSDDGLGGAGIQPGHGLANLRERVQGVGGTLEITSPAGGPTTIAAHLPVQQGE